MTTPHPITDYNRIAAAIAFLDQHARDQPGLEALADHLGLSKYHVQRLFRRWAGLSPKQFLQLVTLEHAKRVLDADASVQDATLEVGLSGSGRLHDHFVTIDGVTPGQYKSGGVNLKIEWAVADSPFGDLFIARTARGVCRLAFINGEIDAELQVLQRQWPQAQLDAAPGAFGTVSEAIFGSKPRSQRLLVRGTNFQVQVWQALLRIPPGRVTSYQQLAEDIARPTSTRAVANAVAANPVAYLIPCHRVLRSSGALGGYRWGTVRKHAMLVWEAASSSGQGVS